MANELLCAATEPLSIAPTVSCAAQLLEALAEATNKMFAAKLGLQFADAAKLDTSGIAVANTPELVDTPLQVADNKTCEDSPLLNTATDFKLLFSNILLDNCTATAADEYA